MVKIVLLEGLLGERELIVYGIKIYLHCHLPAN